VLIGIRAVHGLGVCLELPPPSGHQLGFAFRLRMRFAVWLGVPPPLQFGFRFPGCIPGGVGVGGPLLVPGVADFEALAFGGQLCGQGCGPGRGGMVVLGLGVGELLVGVGFGLGGEPQLAADVGRGYGTGAFALQGSHFKVATV
jgi:hypothetical protein